MGIINPIAPYPGNLNNFKQNSTYCLQYVENLSEAFSNEVIQQQSMDKAFALRIITIIIGSLLVLWTLFNFVFGFYITTVSTSPKRVQFQLQKR